MDNKDIVKKITDHKKGKGSALEAASVIIKFLVFHIDGKKYALYAEQIREIVMDTPLFYVPFVPPYIRGFINRHGEPHTVFDLHVLFEKETLESATYLILNIEHDQMAFLISDVIEILKVPEGDVHLITSIDEMDSYFLGSITSGGSEIFILNLNSLVERLDSDINAS